MEYGLALKEKCGTDGLNRNDVTDLFDKLNSIKAYPIELQAWEFESSAMGFITPEAAKRLDYDYESSGLHDFIAAILDDMDNESGDYEYKGVKIWFSR